MMQVVKSVKATANNVKMLGEAPGKLVHSNFLHHLNRAVMLKNGLDEAIESLKSIKDGFEEVKNNVLGLVGKK